MLPEAHAWNPPSSTFGPGRCRVDLGTANTLVVARGSIVVFDEPSVCCFKGDGTGARFVAAGAEARSLIDRVSNPLRIVRPLRNGVLNDISATRELLKFASRSVGKGWRLGRAARPRILPPEEVSRRSRDPQSSLLDETTRMPRRTAKQYGPPGRLGRYAP